MDEQEAMLTPAEVVVRGHLERWKGIHDKQSQEAKATYILKGSLTRAERYFEESYKISHQVAIADATAVEAAKQELDTWELSELEWQDERDNVIQQLDNPACHINAQLTGAARTTRYKILHAKAKARAENMFIQLNSIKTNLGQAISNRALETLKSQIATSKAEIEIELWKEYEELLELKPDNRDALTGEYSTHKRNAKEAAAALLDLALSLLPVARCKIRQHQSCGPGGPQGLQRLCPHQEGQEGMSHQGRGAHDQDLQSVDKYSEITTDYLILTVLDWVDQHHKDELMDLYRKDELAQAHCRVGIFKLTYNYLKENQINLMKFASLNESNKTEVTKVFCRVCAKKHALPYCSKRSVDVSLNGHESQPGAQAGGGGQGGGRLRNAPKPVPENCKYCKKKAHTYYTSMKTSKTYTSSRLYDYMTL